LYPKLGAIHPPIDQNRSHGFSPLPKFPNAFIFCRGFSLVRGKPQTPPFFRFPRGLSFFFSVIPQNSSSASFLAPKLSGLEKLFSKLRQAPRSPFKNFGPSASALFSVFEFLSFLLHVHFLLHFWAPVSISALTCGPIMF